MSVVNYIKKSFELQGKYNIFKLGLRLMSISDEILKILFILFDE